MSDVHFYHLQRQPLERALPMLLEKCLERGWRAVVQLPTEERVAAIDEALWTYSDESFLPHGTARDGDGAMQPVHLTAGADNPNAASARVFVEGSEALPVLALPDCEPYERVLVVFDGGDAEQLAAARLQWSALKKAGHAVTYWQQNEDGRWDKKA